MGNGLKSSCMSRQKVHLMNSMRLAWEQHVYWTRLTIISLAFNLPDARATTARLLRNATDMGNLLKPFYGEKVAMRYRNLIRSHLVIAAKLVLAAKAGNQRAAAALEKRWYANGEQIAEFLSKINPHISKNQFRKMFFEHLALTKSEAVFILQKKFKSSIITFNKIETEALQMADTITNAIVKQFPKKF